MKLYEVINHSNRKILELEADTLDQAWNEVKLALGQQWMNVGRISEVLA